VRLQRSPDGLAVSVQASSEVTSPPLNGR